MKALKIKENSFWARWAAYNLKSKRMALVLGKTIHLYGVSKAHFLSNKAWLCHELCHVEQYKHFGFFGFLARYVYYSVKYGYYKNPLEKEARSQECSLSLLEKYKVINNRVISL